MVCAQQQYYVEVSLVVVLVKIINGDCVGTALCFVKLKISWSWIIDLLSDI